MIILGNQCNVYDLRSKSCEDSEICDENYNSCQCAPGFKQNDNYCIKVEEIPRADGDVSPPNNSELVNNHTSSSVPSILLWIFICVNIIIVIYVVRKYNIINWMRNKINSFRRSNYDEFMIGQDVDDDPPLR